MHFKCSLSVLHFTQISTLFCVYYERGYFCQSDSEPLGEPSYPWVHWKDMNGRVFSSDSPAGNKVSGMFPMLSDHSMNEVEQSQ